MPRWLPGLVLWLLAFPSLCLAEDDLVRLDLRAFPYLAYGSSGTDLGVEPDLELTVSLTGRWSLRPSAGFGFGPDGNAFHAGATAIFSPKAHWRWRPYLGGGLAWSHLPGPSISGPGSALVPPPPQASDFVTFRGLVGVERKIAKRLAVFAELGFGVTPGRRYEWAGNEWRRRSVFDAAVPSRFGIGLSFSLK